MTRDNLDDKGQFTRARGGLGDKGQSIGRGAAQKRESLEDKGQVENKGQPVGRGAV